MTTTRVSVHRSDTTACPVRRYAIVIQLVAACLVGLPASAPAQERFGAEAFRQLDHELPTPTEVRLGSGAPGPKYWQQKVDYRIEVTLDDAAKTLTGRELITYHNRSPHALEYLWVQLDQNSFAKGSDRALLDNAPSPESFSYRRLRQVLTREDFDGGVNLTAVTDPDGKPLQIAVNKTMMRIDLAEPLPPGGTFRFEIAWWHRINDAEAMGGRGGYEPFDDGTRIYTIAQWFPRMAVYDDVNGWQNKQFLGRGEFALELGDYELAITVPDNHVVAATGTLQNPEEVLSAAQRDRLAEAAKGPRETPVLVVTRKEAQKNIARKPGGTRTWRFRADNVRDVAFASSPRFMWDAMATPSGPKEGGKPAASTLCMSFYPPQAAPLWTRYSTHAIAHTIEVYSRMTFAYPYPVAISVNGPVGGMEYPMISFNGPRAEPDGTYYDRAGDGKSWRRTKYGLISVVIHEVGHNWFPMIINSDERQWTWMDEGLNTFLQYVAEQEWEPDYPSWRGAPESIVEYMRGTQVVPIMRNSESLLQFGNNAYGKPATALNILRETVLGRTVFDFAFRTYARRWRFKRPMPADFFRTMEDAAGADLDWFWRGWFFGTERVDMAIGTVGELVVETRDPDVDKPARVRERDEKKAPAITQERNADEGRTYRLNRFSELKDFYNERNPDAVTDAERKAYSALVAELEPWEKALLASGKRLITIELKNVGGLVMPVPLTITWEDGTTRHIHYPAEIWRHSLTSVTKLIVATQGIRRIEVDPDHAIADVDRSNNTWPVEPRRTRFQLYKEKKIENEMQKARKK